MNWFLTTLVQPHALGRAQNRYARAALEDNETEAAFATHLKSLSELYGNIHSEGTMKQQLIQGLLQ